MRSYLVNVFALVYGVVLFVVFEAGFLSAADGFFGAAVLVAGYTGYQLIKRDGMPLGQALKAIVTKPSSYPRATAYGAYVVSAAIGVLIMAQTVVMSA